MNQKELVMQAYMAGKTIQCKSDTFDWIDIDHEPTFHSMLHYRIKPDPVKQPHKHAELIKAWADGAEIQYYDYEDGWISHEFPRWYVDTEYRIKPDPKPDVVRYLLSGEKLSFYYQWSEFPSEQLDASGNSIRPQIKIIWNGETGKLKSADAL